MRLPVTPREGMRIILYVLYSKSRIDDFSVWREYFSMILFLELGVSMPISQLKALCCLPQKTFPLVLVLLGFECFKKHVFYNQGNEKNMWKDSCIDLQILQSGPWCNTHYHVTLWTSVRIVLYSYSKYFYYWGCTYDCRMIWTMHAHILFMYIAEWPEHRILFFLIYISKTMIKVCK